MVELAQQTLPGTGAVCWHANSLLLAGGLRHACAAAVALGWLTCMTQLQGVGPLTNDFQLSSDQLQEWLQSLSGKTTTGTLLTNCMPP